MGHPVFTLRMWACILWASVLCHCLVQAQGWSDAAVLWFFKQDNEQSAIWDTWNASDPKKPCGWIGVSCTSDGRVEGLHFSSWGLENGLQLRGLTSLGSLRQLDVSSNKFNSMPDFSNLTQLTWLDVSGNHLVPLAAAYNLWDISDADFIKLGALRYLNLAGSNMIGSLPSLDGLVQLEVLSLADNSLTGSVANLAKLANLVDLDLSGNQFTGGISMIAEGLSRRLVRLRLANNNFTGEIPNMEALTSLRNLHLGGNLFTGINESGFRSTSLKFVDISRNKLAGGIAHGVGNMSQLLTLDLSWNNLTGPIPLGLRNIYILDLSNNMLSGSIPEDILQYGLPGCQVDLSANQLSGVIPPSLINAACVSLNLSGNSLEGIPGIPYPDGGGKGYYVTLDLSNNKLVGTFLASNWSSAFYTLGLGQNQLSGDIIEYLIRVLTTHPFATPIWRKIELQDNKFTGDIATFLPALAGHPQFDNTRISLLDLSYNSLKTTADDTNPLQAMLEDPHTVGLFGLRLAGNNLNGISLPQTLNRSLPSLRVLDLSDSFLEGNISQELFTNLGNLVQFSVSMNRLSGGIPANLPATLQILEIGNNNLEGEIPDGIFTNLSSLLIFNASNNRFGKRFPSTLPVSLHVLDLSENSFSGEIPADLFVRLPNLISFNVSNNSLSGKLPAGLPRTVFNESSFANNPGLCGGPLPDCPPERVQSHSKEWVVITVVVVPFLVIISLASCLLLAWKWRKYSKQQEQDADLVAIVLKRTLAITVMPVRNLHRATNNFSESAKIGEGGGGTVYIGHLKDGTEVAVKTSKHRENRERFAADRQQFLTEVQILSQVHHRHLVKLLGCCMQNNKAALVFEFVPNGTLEEHLRGRKGRLLSGEQRLLIALQTSEALAYLHTAAEPPIFHKDVKSSNILLDEDLNAKVADFVISMLAPKGATYVDAAGVQGAFGYIDPEYFRTSQPTAKSDVYSFGAVIVELISGKSPRDVLRGDGGASPENVVLSVMRNGDGERFVDPCLLEIFNAPTGRASMEATWALAARCLAKTSEERPEMKEVRKHLQTLFVQFEAAFGSVKQLLAPFEINGGAPAESPLLDFHYCQFSHTSTGTRSGSTEASTPVRSLYPRHTRQETLFLQPSRDGNPIHTGWRALLRDY